ncbi:MAG: hypothetical protein ACL7BU_09430 [Candidatus Phlomobacter fragariae]
MEINEIYHLNAGEILNILAARNRRAIRVPLLLAVAFSMKSQASRN